jgi:hypothetical protein
MIITFWLGQSLAQRSIPIVALLRCVSCRVRNADELRPCRNAVERISGIFAEVYQAPINRHAVWLRRHVIQNLPCSLLRDGMSIRAHSTF